MRFFVLASFAESLSVFRGPLLEAMKRTGGQVDVAAPGLIGEKPLFRDLSRLVDGCHDIPMARTGMNPVQDMWTFMAVFSLLRRLRPTHFLGYTIKPVVYGCLAAWLARVPQRTALITGLGYAFTEPPNGRPRMRQWLTQRLIRALYRAALASATSVIFQNPDDRALLIELGLVHPAKTGMVNGSGVDLERFAAQSVHRGPCEFLFIARLLKDKGIHEYIDAARAIKRRCPSTVFHLAGWIDSNPQAISEDELQEWVRSGLVTYHGRLADVRDVLARCHVYVLPSYREGTPRTVLEAMATGRAVITSDAPGCRETVVNGYNGFLVPVGDAEALEKAMMRFIDDASLAPRMGEAGRDLASSKFDVHAVNAKMLHLMGV